MKDDGSTVVRRNQCNRPIQIKHTVIKQVRKVYIHDGVS